MGEFEVLFEPFRIGDLKLKNRIAMAPMGLDYMVNPDGTWNRRVVDYYLERVRHDVGMIICGVSKVENQIEALEASTPMLTDASMGYLGELCDAAHSFGTRIIVQLTAGYGRVTVPGTLRGPCVSSSPTPNFWDPSITCSELTCEAIEEIVTAVGDTAERVLVAGVDGIELHGHEGYLFDQFTSAVWNQRKDQYGGSLENRLRFPIECLEEIRKRTGHRVIVQYRFGLKHYMKRIDQGALPGESFQEIGRDIPEGLEMAKLLETAGFDSLHVDAGCYESHYWPHPPNYQKHGCMVDMPAKTKTVVNIPVIGVGRLDKPEVAAKAVAEGKMDIAAIGRGFLADPQWVDKIRSGNEADIRPCVGCFDACFGSYAKLHPISCALNPASGRERAYRLEPTQNPRDVMVIGGGIAGMEAARVAAIRGHRVSLYEKGVALGGLVQQAAVPEFKRDLRRLLAWYERQMGKTGVDINICTEVSLDMLRSKTPDVVIVATGANAIVPQSIRGVDCESVVTAVDLLKGEKTAGKKVVIVGGGLVGCEIAIWLHGQGKSSTIIEMLPELMAGGVSVPTQTKMMTLDLLATCETTILTNSRVCEIKLDGILIEGNGSGRRLIEADSVVLAMGMQSETGLIDEMDAIAENVYRIGDCREPRNVMHAVWDAYEIARFI